ncbi:uncharacterized protein LOC111469445 [Cucurbita maxima]|uniref:Uncharacterized protein LOC111469445 n=1 Tax=Cucurbita maxima TaxID=3661 RepID=A0A6J1I0P4_CUCMA|nr:uncharacterized protein LOC111469445 [Cucurbita maxima]
MEDLGYLWSYQEGIDELKQRLLYTTIELESVKMAANQEITENKQNLKNLFNLLQIAYKERDEAKNQLQKVLNKANSGISESNSLSDAAVSSPDFSSVGDPVIENFVKGKKLPEKGRLLQAVMEAGPLLQTLLVAGPLPRWRNPPQVQSLKVVPPPVLINNSPRICSNSMMNFSDSYSFGSQFQSTKRQRLH